MTDDTPKRIWKCAGCGVQMPSNCDCVANVAVSWKPEYALSLKAELRPETVSENIARDMQEGRFPERSEPQMVVDPSSALASSPEVAALIREAEARGTERAMPSDQAIQDLADHIWRVHPNEIAEDDVSPEVQDRRARFAAGPLARRMTSEVVEPVKSPEDAAAAFGRAAFAAYGRDWPKLMEIARGAAIRAHGDAMGEVK